MFNTCLHTVFFVVVSFSFGAELQRRKGRLLFFLVVCVCACPCVHMYSGADSLELDLEMVVSCLTWTLGNQNSPLQKW